MFSRPIVLCLAIIAVCMLSACRTTGVSTGSAVSDVNSQCSQEIALVCPQGLKDSCEINTSHFPRGCVASGWSGQYSQSCRQEIALICEDDEVDICEINPGSTDRRCVERPVADAASDEIGSTGVDDDRFNPECALEIMLECPRGQVDSCTINSAHGPRGCVNDNWNGTYSQTCMQEIALTCEENEIDVCVLNPAATQRRCVLSHPRPSDDDDGDDGMNPECAMEIALVCPSGQVDSCTKNSMHYPRGCVLSSWDGETVSQTCRQEIALVCDEPLVDSCEINPATSQRACVNRETGR